MNIHFLGGHRLNEITLAPRFHLLIKPQRYPVSLNYEILPLLYHKLITLL